MGVTFLRRSLILFAVLLLLSVGALAAGHAAVSGMQEEVCITEMTYAGEPAAGLRVDLHTYYGNYLSWRTSYTAGTDPAPETDFTFSISGNWEETEAAADARLSIGTVSLGMSGNDLDLTDSLSLGWGEPSMLRPAADVASRTPAGETYTEIFDLRDYYSYYLLNLYCSSVEQDEADMDAVIQYFKIPVREGTMLEVCIRKDEAGRVCEVDMGPVGYVSAFASAGEAPAVPVGEDGVPTLNSESVVTDQGIYLVLWTDGSAAEVFSEIEGGYGVYFIPFEKQESGKLHIAAAQTQNIYALDPETVQSLHIVESQDGTRLLLFTQEQDQVFLTVLDIETRTALQRLPLSMDHLPEVFQEASRLLLYGWNADYTQPRFLLLCQEEDAYRLELDVPAYQFDEADYWIFSPSFCFDGQRLAVAYFPKSYYSCTVCLLVYDQTGLRYAGRYAHNADPTFSPMFRDRKDALRIRWE